LDKITRNLLVHFFLNSKLQFSLTTTATSNSSKNNISKGVTIVNLAPRAYIVTAINYLNNPMR
jgi:hypothetical protein